MKNLEPIKITDEFRERVAQYQEKPGDGVGLLEACSENPVLFVKHMIGVDPYAWQVDVLWAFKQRVEGETDYRDILLNTSRQIGKSAVLSWCAMWATIFNKKPDKSMGNTRVAIVSRADRAARKLLREINLWFRFGDRYMRERYTDEDGNPLFGKHFFTELLSPSDPNNSQMLTLRAEGDLDVDYCLRGSQVGSWIGSFPPTPSVLGETFTIGMIDEAAHRDMPNEFIIRELKPTGNANGAIWISASTPWNANGWFYERMVDETGEVQKFVFSIDAIKDEELGVVQYEDAMRDIDTLKRNGDYLSINIIYYCQFEQADTQYFDPQKVEDMFDEDLPMFEKFDDPCDMGVDFGGEVKSRTVITISYMNPDTGKITRLYHKRYPVGPTLNLLDDIAELMTRFNVQRIIPDFCPSGKPFINEMVDKGWNIQPDGRGMQYRSDKVTKYGAFRAKLNRGEIQSYPDETLLGEMKGLEQSETSTQSKIVAARGATDDLIDSFLQSCYFFVGEETGRFGVIDLNDIYDNDDVEDPWAAI